MVKPDEQLLHTELLKRTAGGDYVHARSVARELGIPEKRTAYILGKWTDRDWWDYGVNVLAGWFTPLGRYTPLDTEQEPHHGDDSQRG